MSNSRKTNGLLAVSALACAVGACAVETQERTETTSQSVVTCRAPFRESGLLRCTPVCALGCGPCTPATPNADDCQPTVERIEDITEYRLTPSILNVYVDPSPPLTLTRPRPDELAPLTLGRDEAASVLPATYVDAWRSHFRAAWAEVLHGTVCVDCPVPL